jgi:hypothetical protein
MACPQQGEDFGLSRTLAKKIVTETGADHMLGSAPEAGFTPPVTSA